jgi:hypothetical protein
VNTRSLACAALSAALLTACASTQVELSPTPQAPVCDPTSSALVLWSPQWRPNQKDVPGREAAAAEGLSRFLTESGCFARSTLRRLPRLEAATVEAERAKPGAAFEALLTVEVRELGPVLRLFSSAALIEGGTEVVLQISARPLHPAASAAAAREFQVHWRHGGPGVIQGVASLPDDMNAALRSGLQPGVKR